MTKKYSLPQTHGFSSSWASEFNPEGAYKLTNRKCVALELVTARSIISSSEEKIPLKNPKGKEIGLSSGAGSSLYVENNNVYKIKRNGFFNQGPTYKPFLLTSIDNSLETESTIKSKYRGIMSKKSAESEARMLKLIMNEGFNQAYEPSDILEYVIPKTKEKAYALICKLKSDLRIDELILSSYTPLMAEGIRKETLSFNSETGLFDAKKHDTLILPEKLSSVLYTIGFSLGSNYKEFHRAGFLRSYPHSWFANEVIDETGNISFVDVEKAQHTQKRTDKFKALQAIEKYQAQSALFSEFETLGLYMFAYGGMKLSEGFSKGYEQGGTQTISPNIIDEILDNHNQHKNILWGEQ